MQEECYVTLYDLKNQRAVRETSLSCFHVNARSAVNKAADLECILSQLPLIDIF